MSSDMGTGIRDRLRGIQAPATAWERTRAWSVIGGFLMLAMAACDNGLGPEDAVVREPFAYQLDAAAFTGLRLVGVNGLINVTNGAPGEPVMVSGFRTVRNCSLSQAEEWSDHLDVRVDESAPTLVVRTLHPRDTGPCTLEVDYEVVVPGPYSVEVGNVNGEVRISGLRGGTSVANVNGNVSFRGLTAPVAVFLTNGDITGDAVLTAGGVVHLTTVNGDVELTVPAASSAVLTATLTNGVIRLTNLALSSQVSTGTMLTGTLGTGDGEIRLRTTNGNITAAGS